MGENSSFVYFIQDHPVLMKFFLMHVFLDKEFLGKKI